MRMVASLLLLLLCAGCSPVVLLFGSAQVVAPFSSVEVIAPDPSFPRVDEQYRCSVAMASGSGWTFDYAYLLSLPSGAGEAAVHQSVTGTNVGIDFKTITRTMATVKGQRLQCRVTATNSGGTFVQISSNTITLGPSCTMQQHSRPHCAAASTAVIPRWARTDRTVPFSFLFCPSVLLQSTPRPLCPAPWCRCARRARGPARRTPLRARSMCSSAWQ